MGVSQPVDISNGPLACHPGGAVRRLPDRADIKQISNSILLMKSNAKLASGFYLQDEGRTITSLQLCCSIVAFCPAMVTVFPEIREHRLILSTAAFIFGAPGAIKIYFFGREINRTSHGGQIIRQPSLCKWVDKTYRLKAFSYVNFQKTFPQTRKVK